MADRIDNVVEKLRLQSHWTQEQLAERVQVTRQTIIAIERGNYSPSVALALRLAQALKTSVEELFWIKKI